MKVFEGLKRKKAYKYCYL